MNQGENPQITQITQILKKPIDGILGIPVQNLAIAQFHTPLLSSNLLEAL